MSRRYRSIEETRVMLTRYESSGQRLSEFCVSEGINKYTFQYWGNKIKRVENSEESSLGFQQILQASRKSDSMSLFSL